MSAPTCLHSQEWQLRGSAWLGSVEGIWCPTCKGFITAGDSPGDQAVYWKLRCAITELALARMELLFAVLLLGVTVITALRWSL